MTTDPAATIAQRPMVSGATHTERAPADAPSAIRTATASQSLPRFCRPSGSTEQGLVVVGEDHRRADEHAVAQFGRLVHQGVVLQLAVGAHAHAGADVRAAADHAALAQAGVLADLRQVPDAAARADLGALVDLRAGLDPVVHVFAFRCLWLVR
ncbi:hypothetical protein SFUMM280S_02845 [Streptomyces fumanus]